MITAIKFRLRRFCIVGTISVIKLVMVFLVLIKATSYETIGLKDAFLIFEQKV